MSALDRLMTAIDGYMAEDRSDLSGTEAAESLTALTAGINRLTGAQIELTGQVENSGVWGLDGSRSAATWLTAHTQASRAAAGADLKLARTLARNLPMTAAAVLAGDLPVAHARILARECTKTVRMRETLTNPRLGEPLLLASAGIPADDFLRVARAWAYRADPDAADAGYREDTDTYQFALSTTTGGVIPHGKLSPDVAEMLQTALRAEIGVPAADDKRSAWQRQHDALGSLSARLLSNGGLGTTHAVRPQIVVHVPLAAALAAPGTPGIPPAWLQDSRTPLPTCLLDRLACDSDLMHAVLRADGEVLHFGRAKRLFEGPQRRAMEARDGHCRYPGCTAPPSHCEGHHLLRWTLGGVTNIDQGALLCWHHHTHVHAHNITIQKTPDGGLTFTHPDGHLIGTTYPQGAPDPDPLPWTDPETTEQDGHAGPSPGTAPGEDSCRGPT